MTTVDRELALQLEAELAVVVFVVCGAGPLERLERHADLPGTTPGERAVLAMLALRRGMIAPMAEAVPLARRALAGGRLVEEARWLEAGPFLYAVPVLWTAGHHEEARVVLDRASAEARRRGSALGFAMVSLMRSAAAYARGDVRQLEAEADLGFRAASEARWQPPLPAFVAARITALLERGAVDDAQRVLGDAGLDGDLPFESVTVGALLTTRAELRLAQHRPQDALADALASAEHAAHFGMVQRTSSNPRPVEVRARLALGEHRRRPPRRGREPRARPALRRGPAHRRRAAPRRAGRGRRRGPARRRRHAGDGRHAARARPGGGRPRRRPAPRGPDGRRPRAAAPRLRPGRPLRRDRPRRPGGG